MKKALLVAIAALLLIAVSLPVAFANADNKQTPNSGPHKNYLAEKLTDAQKADLYKISEQMLNLQKQMIQKYVDFGIIKQYQAQLMINKMTDDFNKMKERGLVPGPGMGQMKGFGREGLKCPLQQNATQ